MPSKPFLTIQQQLDLLKSRGLTIENEKEAAEFLYKNNYYRISGYSLTLRIDDIFISGTSFQNIQDIYNLDNEIRFHLLKVLLKIETEVKSVYAYEFGKLYLPTQYKDASIFTNKKFYEEIIAASNKLKYSQKDSEAYLKHHAKNKIPLPIWAFMGLLTFGTLSKMYYISSNELKNAVSKTFEYKKSKILANHLHCLSVVRNICAHNSRIYGRSFLLKPNLKKIELRMLPKNNDKTDNSKLISILICLKNLLSESDYLSLIEDIDSSINKYAKADIKYYGMDTNWKENLIKL